MKKHLKDYYKYNTTIYNNIQHFATMPKKPIDYANSSIYKLCCRDTDITDCYVGSTTNFRTRKSQHKSSCNKENNSRIYNLKVYQFIREHGGWDNFDMVLVEKVNVNDGNELKKEERKWIEQLNSTLNCQLPTRTRKEWCEDNKDKITERKKIYHEKNKDKIKEKHKQYYKDNKESIKEYHKDWYENNKESIKKYHMDWYENNKEKIQCPICNSVITKHNLSRHQKSMKCINASK